jgi:TonB dependent receptor
VRDTAILTDRLVHEIRFSYRRDYAHTLPDTSATSINVLDTFYSGGAQNDSINDNRTLEAWDMWMYSAGAWNFKSGVQILRRLNHNVNYNNFGGTYTFSTLADYTAGRPVTFSINEGNPFLVDSQIELGTFFQSDWKVTNTLDLTMGLRYEAQTNIRDHNNIDPRIGVAYQTSQKTVIRGGAGVFHARLPQNNVDQLLRFDGTHKRQIVLQFPSFPDPFVNGGPASSTPISLRVRSANLVTPYTMNVSVSLEQSLPHVIGLTLSWDAIRGVHLYRSRDINAPLPGLFLRPDPSAGNLYQLESTGTSRSNNFTVGVKETLRSKRNLNLFANYTLGWNYNDTDGSFALPADNYDLRSEWGRAPSDQRHRFVAGANVRSFWNLNVNMNIQASSNRPYNITTGFDDNHDTNTNDRPAGVRRNTGIGPDFFNANISLQKTVSMHTEKLAANPKAEPAMTFVANFWNALNHPQYQPYSGVMTSAFFGRPNRASNPRNVEVGLRFNF